MEQVNSEYMTGLMLIGGELVESRTANGWKASIPPMKSNWAACRSVLRPIWPQPSRPQRRRSPAGPRSPWRSAPSTSTSSAMPFLRAAEEIARIESLDTGNTLGPMKRDVQHGRRAHALCRRPRLRAEGRDHSVHAGQYSHDDPPALWRDRTHHSVQPPDRVCRLAHRAGDHFRAIPLW